MKKYLLLAIVVLPVMAQAQFFTGLNGSPYGGITTVTFNPAIADSRYLVDINIIAIGAAVNNNYVGVDRRVIFKPSLANDANFQANYMHERVNGRNKRAYTGMQVQGPLSFMFSFGPKKSPNKNAIAFSYHANFITNVDNVTEVLARTAYYGLGAQANSVTNYLGRQLKNANLSIKSAAWMDYGITYSRVLIDRRENLLKVGGTIKLLQPIAGAYGYVNNLNYQWTEYEQLTINNTRVNYAYSDGFATSQGAAPDAATYVRNAFNFKNGPPTVGVDMGVVYEWRPQTFKKDMACNCYDPNDGKKYKIAAGFSVIDFGALRFKRGQYSRDFTADIQNWDVGNANFPDGLQSLDDTISSRFTVNEGSKYFTVWLPTRFNLFVDYNIWKDFGVMGTATISPNMSPNRNMVHHVSTFSIIPKYDSKWFGAYLPLSIDEFANVSLGATLRLGPLTIGTQDLLSLFAKKYVYNAEVHASLKVSIPNKKICPKGGIKLGKNHKV
jgi:hypothetical protein